MPVAPPSLPACLPACQQVSLTFPSAGPPIWQAATHVQLDSAALDTTEEEADREALRSLLRTMVPPDGTLDALTLRLTQVLAEHSFVGCAPLLAGLTRLALYRVDKCTDSTDAALQSALNDLIQLTPRLHYLVFTGDPPRFHEEEEWAAEGGGGKCLSCGLPPAVTALRHLEALSVNFALLPSLPEGPYLTGVFGTQSHMHSSVAPICCSLLTDVCPRPFSHASPGLTSLDLWRNRLAGPLPPALRSATALQRLDMSANAGLCLDTGSVEVLASLPALTSLRLDEEGGWRQGCRQAASVAGSFANTSLCLRALIPPSPALHTRPTALQAHVRTELARRVPQLRIDTGH